MFADREAERSVVAHRVGGMEQTAETGEGAVGGGGAQDGLRTETGQVRCPGNLCSASTSPFGARDKFCLRRSSL